MNQDTRSVLPAGIEQEELGRPEILLLETNVQPGRPNEHHPAPEPARLDGARAAH